MCCLQLILNAGCVDCGTQQLSGGEKGVNWVLWLSIQIYMWTLAVIRSYFNGKQGTDTYSIFSGWRIWCGAVCGSIVSIFGRVGSHWGEITYGLVSVYCMCMCFTSCEFRYGMV